MTPITQKTLRDLGLRARDGRDATITGIEIDSRRVKPGALFAALPGSRIHGAEFIQYAVRMGASAVLTDRSGAARARDWLNDVAVVVAEDPRQVLAYTAALWYAAQPETMVAITGTNGKTSVASFVQQIWQQLGLSSVNLGTTGVEGALSIPLHHTTPDQLTLHRILAQCAEKGVTHAAMEASSHGLDQKRLDGVQLTAAAFTNFSQDHLDYHKTLDAYFNAKKGLFSRVLPEDGVAVINIDTTRGLEMADLAQARGQDVLRVGHHKKSMLQIEATRPDATGQDVRFIWDGRGYNARLSLIGMFQADNAALAAGLAIACGMSAERVFSTLPNIQGVRGRMELAARRSNDAPIFVDYAHTPDALETAITALRPHVMGQLIVVYGAGGDRDQGKRPLMGEAAAKTADVRFVTDDNPRSEDPAAIRSQILQADPDAIEVPDRAEAILRAVDQLHAGDALLVAGKGHETGQIVGDDVFPFDDVEQASVAVAALDGGLA